MEKAYNEDRIPPEVFQAWQTIDRGKHTKDPDLVWEGNALLLEYEQGTTLQEGVYDQNRPMWQKVSSWPFTWVQDIDSPVPGDPTSFQDYVEGGDVGDFGDRWQWIEGSMLPAWQKLESNPQQVDAFLAPCVE